MTLDERLMQVLGSLLLQNAKLAQQVEDLQRQMAAMTKPKDDEPA